MVSEFLSMLTVLWIQGTKESNENPQVCLSSEVAGETKGDKIRGYS